MVDGDGNALAPTDDGKIPAAPINMIGKTFIERLIVKINDKEVYNSGSLYSYSAYLQVLLNYGWGSKNAQHQMSMFYKPTDGTKDTDLDSVANKERGKPFLNKAPVDLFGSLHADVFHSERLMLSDTPISIEIYRHSDPYCIVARDPTKSYKLLIEDMRLYVKKCKPQASLSIAIEKILASGQSARYPIRRLKVTSRHLAANKQTIIEPSLVVGQLPRKVIVGIVKSQAVSGDFGFSPFIFQNCNVVKAYIKAGDNFYPKSPFQLKWADYRYTGAYLDFLNATENLNTDQGNWITLKDYRAGNTLFAFSICPDDADNGGMQLITEGNLSLHMQLAAPLSATNYPQGAEIICLAEYDNLLSIDKNRNPFYDYSL